MKFCGNIRFSFDIEDKLSYCEVENIQMGAQKVWKPVWLDNKKSRQMAFMLTLHLSYFITTVTINIVKVNNVNKLIVSNEPDLASLFNC